MRSVRKFHSSGLFKQSTFHLDIAKALVPTDPSDTEPSPILLAFKTFEESITSCFVSKLASKVSKLSCILWKVVTSPFCKVVNVEINSTKFDTSVLIT